MTSLILPADEVIRHRGEGPALRSHEAGDGRCLADKAPLDEELQVERERKWRVAQCGD